MKVYSLADKLAMARLKNEIVNHFRERSEPRRMALPLLEHMVKHNKPNDAIARYVIDNLAHYLNRNPARYQDQRNQWSQRLKLMIKHDSTFLRLIFEAQMRVAAEDEPPRLKPFCFYHDHDDADEDYPDAEPLSEEEFSDVESDTDSS